MDHKKLFDVIRAIKGEPLTTADVAAVNAVLSPAPAAERKLGAPAAFFDHVRAKFGPLKQTQVEGFNVLLDAMRAWPVSWVAYGLATAWHETGATMQPIKEYGGEAYFKRMYDMHGQRPEKAFELGNVKPGDGALYAGRGYVQLTGRVNYRKFGIEQTPDDAMKPDVAARIMVQGMERGDFTGRKNADYLPGDYKGARRIINGRDKDDLIAGYAASFEAALIKGAWS